MVTKNIEKVKRRRIEVQLSESEFLQIKKFMEDSGCPTIAGFLRRNALTNNSGTSIDSPFHREWMVRYIYQLNKIGTNLNQIANKCNKNDRVDKMVYSELLNLRIELNFHRDHFISKKFPTIEMEVDIE